MITFSNISMTTRATTADASAHYALCRDVTLILQPYGAAIWNDTVGDFAVTNDMGRVILEACAEGGTLGDILAKASSKTGEEVVDHVLRADVGEFLECAENMGHVSRTPSSNSSFGTGPVVGSPDFLSLVRADLSITRKCNLHCDYCYIHSPKCSDELTAQEWQEVFTKLRAAGAKKFIITGGEPFTRPDMLDLLQTADGFGISVTLLTNGTLIDPLLALKLARLKHLREIKISLDSLTHRETHDYFRGAGSWEAAMQGAERVHEQGIPVVVNMTIQPVNYSELYLAVEECAKRGWLMEASPVVLEGRAQKHHLLPSQSLVDYEKEYSRALEAFPKTVRVERPEITPEWRGSLRCGAVYGTIGVSPDGRLMPCLRSESFFSAMDPMFGQTPSVLDLDRVDVQRLSFFKVIEQVQSSFVPQPTECGDCGFLQAKCNGCVVAKSFMEKAGCCPRKEVIRDEKSS